MSAAHARTRAVHAQPPAASSAARRRAARAHRALHVAAHPVIGARDVERRLVGPVQRADGGQVARRPLRDVALRERVDAPVALEVRVGLRRRRPVEVGEHGEHLGAAHRRRGAQEDPEPLGADQHGEGVVALGPARADDALGQREAVGARVTPDRRRVGRDDLRGARLALAVQRGQPRVGDARDRDVAQRADGHGADDGRGAHALAVAQRRDDPVRRHVERGDHGAEPDPVAELLPHRQRERRTAGRQPQPLPALAAVELLRARDGDLAQHAEHRAPLFGAAGHGERGELVHAQDGGRRVLAAHPARDGDPVEGRGVRMRPRIAGVQRRGRGRRPRPRSAPPPRCPHA